jgi:hypothetical protein
MVDKKHSNALDELIELKVKLENDKVFICLFRMTLTKRANLKDSRRLMLHTMI